MLSVSRVFLCVCCICLVAFFGVSLSCHERTQDCCAKQTTSTDSFYTFDTACVERIGTTLLGFAVTSITRGPEENSLLVTGAGETGVHYTVLTEDGIKQQFPHPDDASVVSKDGSVIAWNVSKPEGLLFSNGYILELDHESRVGFDPDFDYFYVEDGVRNEVRSAHNPDKVLYETDAFYEPDGIDSIYVHDGNVYLFGPRIQRARRAELSDRKQDGIVWQALELVQDKLVLADNGYIKRPSGARAFGMTIIDMSTFSRHVAFRDYFHLPFSPKLYVHDLESGDTVKIGDAPRFGGAFLNDDIICKVLK